jgi:hypothetical protein
VPTPPSPDASLTRLAAPVFVFRSIGFAAECLGQHSGGDQEANLGDGHGYRASFPILPPSVPHVIFSPYEVNETAVIRLDYGNPTLGTCEETVEGGNHFRYWTQTGSEADRCGLLALTDDIAFSLLSMIVAPCLWPFLMSFRRHVSPHLALIFQLYSLHPQWTTTSYTTGAHPHTVNTLRYSDSFYDLAKVQSRPVRLTHFPILSNN